MRYQLHPNLVWRLDSAANDRQTCLIREDQLPGNIGKYRKDQLCCIQEAPPPTATTHRSGYIAQVNVPFMHTTRVHSRPASQRQRATAATVATRIKGLWLRKLVDYLWHKSVFQVDALYNEWRCLEQTLRTLHGPIQPLLCLQTCFCFY